METNHYSRPRLASSRHTKLTPNLLREFALYYYWQARSRSHRIAQWGGHSHQAHKHYSQEGSLAKAEVGSFWLLLPRKRKAEGRQ